MGLYQKVRPKTFDDVLGQDHVVNPLRKMVEADDLPSLILLGGPSGVGKTTIARIIRDLMVKKPEVNWIEVNAGTDGGIDKVRAIKDQMRSVPLGSKYKMWLIDEAHRVTEAAAQGFLVPTEDAPPHAKFIFSSSEPDKLPRALQTRASRFDLRPLADDDIMELLRTVSAVEGVEISKEVMKEITANCEGSARQAVVMLEQAAAAKDDDEALEIVQRAGTSKESYNLCKILLEGTWEGALKALKASEKDAESVRRGVLAYMSKGVVDGWLKGPRQKQALLAIKLFQFLFANGMSDLVLATWEYFHAKRG